MSLTADLTRNPKQAAFFERVLEAAYGDNPYRYLFYGGAVRGGKTYAGLICLVILCKLFPGSKWYVIRKTFSRLEETALPSMHKLLGHSQDWRWNLKSTNYYVEHKNGSRIYFAGENYNTDPKLDWMLGLECNGFLLEQVEELQEKTHNMAISRSGSWLIDPMPTPLILATFNPTQTWVKQRVFDPWRDGKLEPPYFFEEAKAEDNPFVTAEQWAAWQNLPTDMYAQFIEASWEFAKSPRVFAYGFNERACDVTPFPGHHEEVRYNPDYPLYLSFDFNVEPITCLAAQHSPDMREWIHLIREFRLLPSDIYQLCERILAAYSGAFFMVTGDASGSNRTAITRGNKNYYKIIMAELGLGMLQKKVPKANPGIRNTRVLCNALLQKHPRYRINTLACPHLTIDLNTVEVNDEGELDEGKDKRKGHLLDGWRYYHWTFHRDFIDKSLYQYLAND